MEFKSFFIVWTIFLCSLSLVFAIAPSIRQNLNIPHTTSAGENHFSVVWKGFSPTGYSSPYPDYYICINDLAESTLTMNINLQIKNQEAYGFYFQIDQPANYTPPTGWTISPYNHSEIIPPDGTDSFVYSGLQRSTPLSIPGGVLTENVQFAVKAFWDEGLTNPYSQDNANATFNFIDRDADGWTIIEHNNFDDGTIQGWTYAGVGGRSVVDTYYRSYQYSLRLSASGGYDAAYRKTFDTTGPYQEAYLIFAIRSEVSWSSNGLNIQYDGVDYFMPDVNPSLSIWYQFALPLPANQTTQVDIWSARSGYAYLDDVYVLAR